MNPDQADGTGSSVEQEEGRARPPFENSRQTAPGCYFPDWNRLFTSGQLTTFHHSLR